MKKTIFKYEGQPITFERREHGQMVNVTQMAANFNKQPKDFFKLKQTANYINALYNSLIISRREDSPIDNIRSFNTENLARYYPSLVEVVKGGNERQGTWVHEKVALKFAAWLSPDFEVWVFDRIQELLTTGKTEIDRNADSNIFKALRQMIDQLEAQDEINKQVSERLEITSDRLDEVEAKLTIQDNNFLSVAGYCSLYGIDCPLDKAQRWGVKATTLSKKLDKHFYQIHDPRFGRVGVYHTEVLAMIITD